MFSGIRSIIFGNSDPVNENSLTTDTDANSSNNSGSVNDSTFEKHSLSNETSALIEQTLNAATTKLTEQLLPQSASIEELQSSSHQLLPVLTDSKDINEQSSFNANSPTAASSKGANQEVDAEDNDDYDDYDENFNPDSWELLDLIEKPQANVCPHSVQESPLQTINEVDEAVKNDEELELIEKPEDICKSSMIAINQDDEDVVEVAYEALPSMNEDNSSELSIEMIMQESSNEFTLITDENIGPVVVAADEQSNSVKVKPTSAVAEKKSRVQVRPLEPERQPGWQLRKKRSRRHPFGTSQMNSNNTNAGNQQPKTLLSSLKQSTDSAVSQQIGGKTGNANNVVENSARVSPNIIDRIGTSIVANLNSLTSSFPPGSIPMQTRTAMQEAEKMRKTNLESNLINRRSLSKNYMARQNACARVSNSNRRADRRLKMHTTPNGCSVNRKVQTNFH